MSDQEFKERFFPNVSGKFVAFFFKRIKSFCFFKVLTEEITRFHKNQEAKIKRGKNTVKILL